MVELLRSEENSLAASSGQLISIVWTKESIWSIREVSRMKSFTNENFLGHLSTVSYISNAALETFYDHRALVNVNGYFVNNIHLLSGDTVNLGNIAKFLASK